MNAELKARWIAALESGKYQKGQGMLCDDKRFSGEVSYCCLGVLADIENLWGEVDDMDLYPVAKNLGYIPAGTAVRLGITNVQATLADINDHAGTFDPVIEKIKELL